MVVLAAAGLAAELAYFYAGLSGEVAAFFSLGAENNLPTWYASSLLLCCGLALGAMARRAASHRAHWWGLAVVFFYISLDEAVELHELLGGWIGTGGVLYFDWVIPAAAVVLLIGILYLPFLRALDPALRRRFVIAGAIYVGGALGMELPLGWWTEQHGDDNIVYVLIDLVEETMELAGTSVFLAALMGRLREP